MDRQGKPNFGEIRDKFNLSQQDIETHWKACSAFSESYTKALESIPQDKRDRIAQYYKYLRSIGIIMHSTTKYYHGSKFPEPSGPVERITRDNCKAGECSNCYVRTFPEKANCINRTREWNRGIETIMSKHRTQEEGQKMAEEVIYYMEHDFMAPKKDQNEIPF